jgi:hypothetical protein
MNWKKTAIRFIKNKKPNETLEMALKRAHAFTLKNKTIKLKKTLRHKKK